jgi:hypothetical protein
MPSEYDFLLPYSGPLRRVGTLMAVGGAFLGGMICAGVVVALMMKTPDDVKDAGTLSWLHPPAYELAAAPKPPTQPQAIRADTAPVATPKPAPQAEAKPIARAPDRPPEAAPRQTVGQSNPGTKLEDRPSAPSAVASTEPSAGELPAPSAVPKVATTEPEAKPDRPRKRVNRARAAKSKVARRRGDEREELREFVDAYGRRRGDREEPREVVDAYGRRHVVLPRRWQDDGRVMAYDRPSGLFARPVPGGYYSRY